MPRLSLFASSLLLATVLPSQSARVFGTLEGSVSNINETLAGDAPDSILTGQTATISFSYESDAVYTSLSANNGTYNNGLDLEISITINGLTWEGSDPDGRVGIANDFPSGGGSIDRLVYETNTVHGPTLPTFASFPNQITGPNSISFLSLVIEDTSPPANLLSNLALPTSLAEIDASETSFSFFRIQTEDTVSGDRYLIDIVTDASTLTLQVPESSSAFLLITGTLTFLSRRRRAA